MARLNGNFFLLSVINRVFQNTYVWFPLKQVLHFTDAVWHVTFLTIQVTIEFKTKRNVRKESVRKVSQTFNSYCDLLGCYSTKVTFFSIH